MSFRSLIKLGFSRFACDGKTEMNMKEMHILASIALGKTFILGKLKSGVTCLN